MRQKLATDEYNNLFQSSRLNLVDVIPDDLPIKTRLFVGRWLDMCGIPYQAHQPAIDGIFLFKIKDPKVVYLIHDSENGAHMWGDAGFDNLDNNTALAHLASRLSGADPEQLRQLFEDMETRLNLIDGKLVVAKGIPTFMALVSTEDFILAVRTVVSNGMIAGSPEDPVMQGPFVVTGEMEQRTTEMTGKVIEEGICTIQRGPRSEFLFNCLKAPSEAVQIAVINFNGPWGPAHIQEKQ